MNLPTGQQSRAAGSAGGIRYTKTTVRLVRTFLATFSLLIFFAAGFQHALLTDEPICLAGQRRRNRIENFRCTPEFTVHCLLVYPEK